MVFVEPNTISTYVTLSNVVKYGFKEGPTGVSMYLQNGVRRFLPWFEKYSNSLVKRLLV